MPTHWFFFRYARDRDVSSRPGDGTTPQKPYQQQFLDDLVAEIRRLYGEPPPGG